MKPIVFPCRVESLFVSRDTSRDTWHLSRLSLSPFRGETSATCASMSWSETSKPHAPGRFRGGFCDD